MRSQLLRSSFNTFFLSCGHTLVKSSPVVPLADPTLLFVNAGMNQFKDDFLGLRESEYTRAVSIQKCIRAGGKHNDLSQVGFTKRHLTFFEMMGNFSFGDYFKKDAILYAWECITKIFQLPPEKCWVTVYEEDQEAFLIWKDLVGIPVERIGKLGKKDNFWQMGDVGPCGPCSEIYIDRGIVTEYDKSARPGDDASTRFVEIWNLVFMEFNRLQDGSFEKLKRVGVDTGMGLERLAMIMQDVETVFDTDVFASSLQYVQKRLPAPSHLSQEFTTSAYRVLADHIRSVGMVLSEGVMPSNEGRGYVIRKIIRRALLFSYKLGDPFVFSELVDPFVASFVEVYHELRDKKNLLQSIIVDETKRFLHNLEQGEKRFLLLSDSEEKVFSGKDAFLLYDTYGFPLELTQVMAHEKGMSVDEDQFEESMEEQRQRSKQSSTFKGALPVTTELITSFIGYESTKCQSVVQGIIFDGLSVDLLKQGDTGTLIVDVSCFYPGGGGQVCDRGVIICNGISYDVENVIKISNAIGFTVKAKTDIALHDALIQHVDSVSRESSSIHHTCAHLLQAELRRVYGTSVKQAGSYVCPEYMRFDVSMEADCTIDDSAVLENNINAVIRNMIPVVAEYTTYDKAVAAGAMALFTEKYEKNNVRMVSIGDFSRELCGGLHVLNTGKIGTFKIVDMSLLSLGVRRFVVVAGAVATKRIADYYKTLSLCSQSYRCPFDKVYDAVVKNLKSLKDNQKSYDEFQSYALGLCATTILLQNKEDTCVVFECDVRFSNVLHQLYAFLQKKRPAVYVALIKQQDSYMVGISIGQGITVDYDHLKNALEKDLLFNGKVSQKHIQGMVKITSFSELENKIRIIMKHYC